jgi:sulfatase modifying factor 1
MFKGIRGGWGWTAYCVKAVLLSGLLAASCGGDGSEDESEKACVLACSHHGTCEWRDGEQTCDCDPGYAGDRCNSCAEGYERDAEGDCTETGAAGAGGRSEGGSSSGASGAAGTAGSSGAAGCVPDCEGKECGFDGCGSLCAPGCSSSQGCHAGQCEDLVYGPEGQSCSAMTGTECNGESCCTSIVIPGGTFPMGRGTEVCSGCADGCPSGTDCYADERPEHPATLSSFHLDKYEVTVGRFRAFVEAFDAGWRPSEGEGANTAVESAQGLALGATGWQSAWDPELPTSRAEFEELMACHSRAATWTASTEDNETYPINCVRWHEAFAFCIWDGGRLPIEAEWEYVAAGGDENRVYPWGNDVTEPLPANYSRTAVDPLVAVGSYPAGNGRWGHADLAGSMWEWVLDWYSSHWYTTIEGGCSDCASLEPIAGRVVRGGCWGEHSDYLRASMRGVSSNRCTGVGFRCSRSEP